MIQLRQPIVKPSTVRIATPADEPGLRALLDRLHIDNPNPGKLPIADHKVWAMVNAVCRGQGAIAGVMDDPDGGGIIASIGMCWCTPWYTEQGYISQYWLYVDPPFRGGGQRHRDLVKFAKWHRADMSVRLGYNVGLENSFITRKRFNAKHRLWNRGFDLVGALYWLDK